MVLDSFTCKTTFNELFINTVLVNELFINTVLVNINTKTWMRQK